MPRDSDAHAGVIMMAFVMGAIAGAATALLVAPTSGSETRRALNERAREGGGRRAVLDDDVVSEGRGQAVAYLHHTHTRSVQSRVRTEAQIEAGGRARRGVIRSHSEEFGVIRERTASATTLLHSHERKSEDVAHDGVLGTPDD